MTETLGMIVHRLKFKTCKLLEVYWIFVEFNKILMGSIFFGSPSVSNHNVRKVY